MARYINRHDELETPYVNIKSFHLPYETSAEERAAGRAEFENAGLRIVGGGTIYLEMEESRKLIGAQDWLATTTDPR